MGICSERIPGRGGWPCKGPEAGTCLVCLRNMGALCRAEAQWARGKVGGEEGTEVARTITQGLWQHQGLWLFVEVRKKAWKAGIFLWSF